MKTKNTKNAKNETRTKNKQIPISTICYAIIKNRMKIQYLYQ